MSAMHQALKMPQPEVLGIADMKMISTSWLIVNCPVIMAYYDAMAGSVLYRNK